MASSSQPSAQPCTVAVQLPALPTITGHIVFERVEGRGFVVAAQAVWFNVLGSTAQGRVKVAHMQAAWGGISSPLPPPLTPALVHWPEHLQEPDEQLVLTPIELMQLLLSEVRVGKATMEQRLAAARVLLEPMGQMLRGLEGELTDGEWLQHFIKAPSHDRRCDKLIDAVIQEGQAESSARRSSFRTLRGRMPGMTTTASHA